MIKNEYSDDTLRKHLANRCEHCHPNGDCDLCKQARELERRDRPRRNQ